jgi:hypothetical protein
MPPRKGPRNVVKSGNAGNSSKASPLPSKAAPASDNDKKNDKKNENENAPPARPPPLFPVGYKSPVTLLNERCQKEGWERPIVDSVRSPDRNVLSNLTYVSRSQLSHHLPHTLHQSPFANGGTRTSRTLIQSVSWRERGYARATQPWRGIWERCMRCSG